MIALTCMQSRPPKTTLRLLSLMAAGLFTGGLTLAFLRGVRQVTEGVPALFVDDRELAALRRVDAQLLGEAHGEPAEYEVALAKELALLNRAYANYMARGRSGAGESEIPARVAVVQTAVANSMAHGPADDPLRPLMRLRAAHFHEFLAEFSRSRVAKQDSTGLLNVGAQFLLRMRELGYIRGYETDLSDDEFATLYKMAWNNSVGMDVDLGWGTSTRAMAAPYKLTHAHRGLMIALALRSPASNLPYGAKPAAIKRARLESLVGKIQDAGKYDPNYPTEYALGVAYTLLGRESDAREKFELAAASRSAPALRTSGYLLPTPNGRVD